MCVAFAWLEVKFEYEYTSQQIFPVYYLGAKQLNSKKKYFRTKWVAKISGRGCRGRRRGRSPDRPLPQPRQHCRRLRHWLPAGIHLQAQALHLSEYDCGEEWKTSKALLLFSRSVVEFTHLLQRQKQNKGERSYTDLIFSAASSWP